MVASYQAAMKELLASRGRTSIQPVFELGIQASAGARAVDRDLSDEDLKSLQERMPGFIVQRGEPPVIKLDAEYFRSLANRNGMPADRAFFDIYARTETKEGPAYVRQQSNGGPGCTLFEGKTMIPLYRGWLGFRAKYPDAYESEAEGEIDSLDIQLTSGICACGNKGETLGGLQAFVDAFPSLPMTPKIKDRIVSIRSGKSNFRFACKSAVSSEVVD